MNEWWREGGEEEMMNWLGGEEEEEMKYTAQGLLEFGNLLGVFRDQADGGLNFYQTWSTPLFSKRMQSQTLCDFSVSLFELSNALSKSSILLKGRDWNNEEEDKFETLIYIQNKFMKHRSTLPSFAPCGDAIKWAVPAFTHSAKYKASS